MTPAVVHVRCYEDQSCWDWRKMGNHCRGYHGKLQCAIVRNGKVIRVVIKAAR